MNGSQRFQATMHFCATDRAPNIEVGIWSEALTRWRGEGMPEQAATHWLTFNGSEFFGLDAQRGMDLHMGMIPGLPAQVIEEDDLTIVARGGDGIVRRSMKDGSSMPQFLAYPVTSRDDFLRLRGQYDADDPRRLGAHWPELCRWAPGRDCIIWGPGMGVGGLYSMLRNWMGTENACTVFYDDPAWAHEMLDFVCDFNCRVVQRAMKQVVPDYLIWWEDFAFKNGPLVSPSIFKEFLLPRYRRMNEMARRMGVDIIFCDSDGNTEALLGLMLESGINGAYPNEAAAGMDPVAIRKRFGRELLLWGGVDKRVLARDKRAIDAELHAKLPPLLADGGYIPQVDHMVPPDVSYENWLYYLDLKRRLLEGK